MCPVTAAAAVGCGLACPCVHASRTGFPYLNIRVIGGGGGQKNRVGFPVSVALSPETDPKILVLVGENRQK